MDFSTLKKPLDVTGFHNALMRHDFEWIFQFHKQTTPWVNEATILEYIKDYVEQVRQIEECQNQTQQKQNKIEVSDEEQIKIKQSIINIIDIDNKQENKEEKGKKKFIKKKLQKKNFLNYKKMNQDQILSQVPAQYLHLYYYYKNNCAWYTPQQILYILQKLEFEDKKQQLLQHQQEEKQQLEEQEPKLKN